MIYYLGYYANIENNEEQRDCSIAAVNKMNYICQAISSVGERVQIVSASGSKLDQKIAGREEQIFKNVYLKFFSSGRKKNVFYRVINRVKRIREIERYLCDTLSESDTLLVYHSVSLIPLLKKLRKKKNFRLILEVNELYSDVSQSEKERKKEFNIFKKVDGFLFATELLNDKINKKHKPYLVNNGTYKIEKIIGKTFDDGVIHCVYAGTFDEKKGGALAAVESAQFLDNSYHIHILGFGTQQEIDHLQSKITEINMLNGCGVSYDGLLNGLEYVRFLQRCHIGLSTQDATKEFNSTSFPSKLLSYLSNGLKIVSARMQVIEKSNIGDMVFYYDQQNPKQIAEAIIKASKSVSYDARGRLVKLDEEFKKNIKNLLIR